MMPIGYQGITHEWRYPVVDRREPIGVRTVKGYVVLLRRDPQSLLGHKPPRPQYSLILLDANELPITTFARDDFWLFVGAVRAAVESVEGYETEDFWTEIWKTGGISHPIHAAEVTTPDSSSE